jgi:GT2 family glycosyltransferase
MDGRGVEGSGIGAAKGRGAASGRLVAVVVTHDRLDKLKVTLARLLDEPVEAVLVVDNASRDGTAEWLAAQAGPRVEVLTLPENCGGAGGFEAGMRHAAATFDPDWMVLTDDDGRPAPGALAAFGEADLTGWDAAAAAVRYPDGRICEMNRPWVNPFWHARAFLRTVLGGGRAGFHLPDAAYRGAPRRIDGTSFVGFFVRRAAIGRAGFPDGRLFIYGDDVLYTLGLTQRGGRIAFLPEVRFEHDCASLRPGDRRVRPVWRTYYHHRNLLLVYRRAAGPLFWLLLPLVIPKWLLKGRGYGPDRAAFDRLTRMAIRDGLRGRRDRTHADILRAAAGGHPA